MNNEITSIDPVNISCIIFDFGFTLSSDLYFKVAPPECPNWQDLIQQNIFANNELVNSWMAGVVTLHNIAEQLAPLVDLEIPRIVSYLELGCQSMNFNEAVLSFAIHQREAGRKTAIVTGNMDVFTKIVVPFHGLNDKFDIIINSFDYGELDKSFLWDKAFELLGDDVGYSRSLLIEDGAKNVGKFRKHGSHAYQYTNEIEFLEWLESEKSFSYPRG